MKDLVKRKGTLLVLAFVVLASIVLLYQQFIWIEVFGIVYRDGAKLDLRQKVVVTISVIEESDKYRIDPRLTLAIIKKESQFQPQIRSYAGALGLMQLEPVSIQEMDPSQTDRNKIAEQLRKDVAYNIHYGVAYLRRLLDRFDGHIGWALEAYNEGPTAVGHRYDGKAMHLTGYPAAVMAIYDSYRILGKS